MCDVLALSIFRGTERLMAGWLVDIEAGIVQKGVEGSWDLTGLRQSKKKTRSWRPVSEPMFNTRTSRLEAQAAASQPWR